MQDRLRANLRLWLPELKRGPTDLVEAVGMATSFEAWDRLRGDRQLSPKVAAAVVERTVSALESDGRLAARSRR